MTRKKVIEWTYKGSGAASPVNHKVGHVSNQVRGESQVEEHVKDIEQHFSWILSM